MESGATKCINPSGLTYSKPSAEEPLENYLYYFVIYAIWSFCVRHTMRIMGTHGIVKNVKAVENVEVVPGFERLERF